ncbi:MAG: phosphatase domain-containing protein, partial [Arenimonas sp.]
RAMLDATGCSLSGRVLQRPAGGDPRQDDDWWDNLLNTYRRFDSEPMPGVSVDLSFRGQTTTAITDKDGYYHGRIAISDAPAGSLWETAEVSRSEGGPVFLQPVLCVPKSASFGVISDIDDTVLESSITHWQTAAQLTFLHNAQTRKPLEGVAKLYQAFQHGVADRGPNPIFYVSASPWNLYDLLEDFFDLNEIPQGPIQLRDLKLNRASLSMDGGTRDKLGYVHELIERYPQLQWVLMGDSGQIDADLYAQTIKKYPGKILAVYIRDIDTATDTPLDKFVASHIEGISSTGVPMLLVADSNAIAEHARKLGLIEPEEIKEVAKEVQRDQARPELKDAVKAGVQSAVADAVHPTGG